MLRRRTVLTLAALVPAAAARSVAGPVRLRLRFGHQHLMATLANNGTARDFAALLPLTISMADLFGREKYGRLPRLLSAESQREHRYAIGQIIYWSPGPDVAVFYRHDGRTIPEPGIIVLGTVDGGIERLNWPGAVTVTIEVADSPASPMRTSP